jgi:hypothetical protein
MYVRNAAGSSDLFSIKGNGNVGIGTPSPGQKLEVANGRIAVDSNYGFQLALTSATQIGRWFNSSGINYLQGDSTRSWQIGSTTNGVNTYFDNINNRVGIGTTSPDVKLHVSGNAKATNIYVADSIIHTGDTNNYFKFDTDTQIFATSGAERLRITSGGNVGIGTTSPLAPLSIGNSSSETLEFNNSVSSQSRILSYDRSDNSYRDLVLDGLDIIFKRQSSEAMRITSSRNVGIGTSSPSRKLSVYQSSSSLVADFRSASGNESFISLSNNGSTADQVRIGSSGGNLILSTNYVERLRIASTGNVGIGTTSPAEKLTVSGDANVTGKFAVGAASVHGTYDFYNQLTSYFNGAMTVDASFTQTGGADSTFSGDVGIGTTSPGTALHIRGDNTSVARMLMIDQGSTGDASMSFRLAGLQEYAVGIDNSDGNRFKISNSSGVGTNDLLTIEPGGDVGIGTNNPESILHISDANPEFILEDTTNPNKCKIRNVDGSLIYDADYNSEFGNSRHRFFIDGSEKLRIEAGGNVGIGTTSPSEKLDVAGSIVVNTGQSLKWGAGATRIVGLDGSYIAIYPNNSEKVRFLSNGNVLIGTTTDNGDKLTVEGNISGSGTGSFESVAIPGTTADYYIGGSGGGAATNELRIGSTHTPNNIALELYHSLNPVSLGIGYSNGGALAFIESVHGSYDTNTHMLFKPGGTETWRIGSHGSSVSNKFQIQPAAAANDFVIADNSGNAILYSDTSTQRIGIGTTTPSEKLDVAGTTKSAGLHITGATRIDQGGGTAPIPLPNQAPTDAIAAQGIQGTNIFLSEPDEWLVINIGGADYVIPAYLT